MLGIACQLLLRRSGKDQKVPESLGLLQFLWLANHSSSGDLRRRVKSLHPPNEDSLRQACKIPLVPYHAECEEGAQGSDTVYHAGSSRTADVETALNADGAGRQAPA